MQILLLVNHINQSPKCGIESARSLNTASIVQLRMNSSKPHIDERILTTPQETTVIYFGAINSASSVFGRSDEYRGVDNNINTNAMVCVTNAIAIVGNLPKFSIFFAPLDTITPPEKSINVYWICREMKFNKLCGVMSRRKVNEMHCTKRNVFPRCLPLGIEQLVSSSFNFKSFPSFVLSRNHFYSLRICTIWTVLWETSKY